MRFKNRTWIAASAGMVLLSVSLLAQGRGAGYGRMGAGPRMVCQAGMGGGGWWTVANPQTPAEHAFVDQVTDLHNQMRQANQELYVLRLQNAPTAQITAKQQAMAGLRAELQEMMTANSALLQKMGIPAGCGMCRGRGWPGYGCMGAGRGAGMGRFR